MLGEKEDTRLIEEIKHSHINFGLHLNNVFPEQIFMGVDITKLRRLDLSYNKIVDIPARISCLSNLRELWLQHNPITSLPTSLQDCSLLEVIDISSTNITIFPPEMATLAHLHEVDWRNSPMESYYFKNYDVTSGDLDGLMTVCDATLDRNNLSVQLLDFLLGTHFVYESDTPGAVAVIKDLVQTLSGAFPVLEEYRIFVRRAGKMLPEKLSQISPKEVERVRRSFDEMHHDTMRQCLSAEVEIKLRNFYFDRADAQMVSAMLADIYDHVSLLEDVQFLVKYATQLLPPRPEEVSGAAVWDSICVLQKDLMAKREATVTALVLSMRQLYPELSEESVTVRAREVAAQWQKERFATKREVMSMSRLVAECGRIFPLDFDAATPQAVYAKAQSLFKTTSKLL